MPKLNKDQEKIVEQFSELWAKYPEMRIGQLIGNVFPNGSGTDPYFLSNSEFMRKMVAFYDPSKSPIE